MQANPHDHVANATIISLDQTVQGYESLERRGVLAA